MKHIVRIKQHPEKNHFQALEEYLARCRLEGENDFIKESEGILEQMILMKDLMRVASLQESAISTAILGPMMRLLGFYKTTFGVIHEAPVNFRFIGGSYQKIGNEIVLHDEEEEHEVKGKLDFLVLSGKSEEKSEAISYSGIHYLEFWQWQLAIEVKKSNEGLSKYINQLLIYMNINVNPEQPKYGLLTN